MDPFLTKISNLNIILVNDFDLQAALIDNTSLLDVLKFQTVVACQIRPRQTVKTDQSDQGLPCLLF